MCIFGVVVVRTKSGADGPPNNFYLLAKALGRRYGSSPQLGHLDWLPVHMLAASHADKGHSSAMRIAAFCMSYDEVIAAPRYCFARRIVGLTESSSVTTTAVPSWWMINFAFTYLISDS